MLFLMAIIIDERDFFRVSYLSNNAEPKTGLYYGDIGQYGG
jgi:hypothetical protein